MKNLILSRKPNQTVEMFDEGGKRIGSVKVVRFRGKSVRLAFSADETIRFLRGELEHRENAAKGVAP